MQEANFINYNSVEDFILDKEFTHWVLHPDPNSDKFWSNLISKYPDKKVQIREAILIIKSMQPVGLEVPHERLQVILNQVRRSSDRKKQFLVNSLKYAAAIVLLIGISSLWYLYVNTKNHYPVEASNESRIKGKVILSDGSTKEFDTESTFIKQTTSGKLVVNNDTIEASKVHSASVMNEIIIPFGKRSDILLADGTHIWLNSGSQLSYPSQFKSDSREVFLSGEAFFEVTPHPKKPFYVITRDIKIKVLGTSFNVTAYADDQSTQTVLVTGKVSAAKNKLLASTIDLIPGERLTYDKNTSNMAKDKVDVQLYSSWLNGYLIFENRPICEVYTKLERYYNQHIVLDESIGKVTFSGKLDLKATLNDVLENIAFASSVKVLENNGSYLIRK